MLRFIFLALLSASALANPAHGLFFEAAEHTAMGDEVRIHFSQMDQGHTAHVFNLPNGLELSYGDIVSFGDFYETPEKPISQGKSGEERKARFRDAFNSFALNPTAVDEANKILEVMHAEHHELDEGMARGEKPEDIYKKIGNENNRKWNCITGGGCSPSTWWMYPGRYLQLAEGE